MDVSFSYFLDAMSASPVLLITVLLTLGVIFVNGWTDAPNAIATCITTRCMKPRPAIMLSAVFNFLGVLVMTHFNSSVASTISNMVDFGGDTREALIALCAALFSIVVYSVAASMFGIPTSESHSLIAGLSGAAIAIQNGVGGINMSEWVKVLYGLVASLALGFCIGWVVCKGLTILCRKMDRRRTNQFFTGAEIFGAAAMSFMHGAQDGQKFIGVLFLGVAFSNGHEQRKRRAHSRVADAAVQRCDGHWHQRGRREDHQGRGHGHGEAGKIPGLLRGPLRGAVPAALQPVRHPGFHHPHQDQRHHGRGGCEAAFRHQLRRGEGHGAHLGVHLPRLRA